MKKFVVVLFLVIAAIGASTQAGDYRVDVQTNRDVYAFGEVMGLQLSLYNESPAAVPLIERPDEPNDFNETAVAFDEVEPAIIDDEPVDVEYEPVVLPRVIGYARLTPLHIPADVNLPVICGKPFRLPLFGSPVVPSHSTRIISTAAVLIKPCIRPDLNDVNLQQPEDIPVETVKAVAAAYVLHPGAYLLECNVVSQEGNARLVAQKIIRIIAMRPPSIHDMFRHVNGDLDKLNKKTTEIAATSAKAGHYALYNNNLLRYIIQYMFKKPLPGNSK